MNEAKGRAWTRYEPDPIPPTAEEVAMLDAAYIEWEQLLKDAIASGDQQRINEVWDLGQ